MSDKIQIRIDVDTKSGVAEVKGLGKGMVSASDKGKRAFKNINRYARQAGNAFKGITKRVFSLKSALISFGGIYVIKRMTADWEKLSSVQEQAEAGMLAAMKSMGRESAAFRKQVLDAAAGIQKVSTAGDEAVIAGTKFLMTYGNIGNDVMPEVMRTMTDLAALMKGDFTSAANMLGKASMGMTGELRRAGITVDTDTFKLHGFAGVLKQIQEQVKGQSAALRATKSGGLEAFGNVVGDVKEKFGLFTSTMKIDIANTLLPHVDKLNEKLAEWIGSGQMEADAKRWAATIVSAIKTVKKALTPLADAMKNFHKTMGEWTAKWERLHGVHDFLRESEGEYLKSMRTGGPIFWGKMPPRPEAGAESDVSVKTIIPGIGTPGAVKEKVDELKQIMKQYWQEETTRAAEAMDAAWAYTKEYNQHQIDLRYELMGKRTELDQTEADTSLFFMQEKQNAEIEAMRQADEVIKGISRQTGAALQQIFANLFFDFMTGEFKRLKDYGTAVFKALASAASQLMAQLIALKAFKAFGLGGDGFLGGFATIIGHSGGVVGKDAMPSRTVPAHLFLGAPKLHSGLRSDEYPAILQRGETVLQKGKSGNIVNNLYFYGDIRDEADIDEIGYRVGQSVEDAIRGAL